MHRLATVGQGHQAALLHPQRAAGSPDTAPSSTALPSHQLQLQVHLDQPQHSPYRLTCLAVVAAAGA